MKKTELYNHVGTVVVMVVVVFIFRVVVSLTSSSEEEVERQMHNLILGAILYWVLYTGLHGRSPSG